MLKDAVDEARGVPLLRMSISTACLFCPVKTSQQAAWVCLFSFSHLWVHNVSRVMYHELLTTHTS